MPENPDELAALPAPSIDPTEPLTIGDVMRRTGVSASALHFYERKGLISSTRTSSNQRLYERHMLRRISLVLGGKTTRDSARRRHGSLPAPTHRSCSHS